jgi:hypothetical protein
MDGHVASMRAQDLRAFFRKTFGKLRHSWVDNITRILKE